MTCEICIFQAATTETMLRNRAKNLAAYPDVEVYKCPVCGGQDWATTRERIREMPRGPWWRRLFFGEK